VSSRRTLPPAVDVLAQRCLSETRLQIFIDKKLGDAQNPIGYRAQIEAVLAHDTSSRLKLIKAPTLVLTGDDDRVIPGESSHLLVERIPNAALRIIPGTGHLFFLERPDATIEILGEFLGHDDVLPPMTARRCLYELETDEIA
jgi:pimeloyl-ACP methyl ester carboxylesterase